MKCHGDYNGHRIAQAFELSQVVKNTSDGCDVVILGGDFNYCPDEVGCKIIMYNGNLKDAWPSQVKTITHDDMVFSEILEASVIIYCLKLLVGADNETVKSGIECRLKPVWIPA